PRRWRAGWLLALSIVVLLVGILAVSAWASPAAPQQPPPNPPLPIPTVDPCTPNSPLPVCQLPAPTTTKPLPTLPLPLPTGVPAPTTCSFPGQIGCTPSAPTTPGQLTTTPSTPCTGEDCIPQPSTPPPGTGPQQPGNGNGDSDSDCGITDIGGCITEAINSAFRSVVDAALSPILELIGHTALSTPAISDLPGIGELWNNSWELVLALYGFFILGGGILLMGHESVQSRYSIKEIGPRIPIAFLASALSLFFADKFIKLANALTLGVLGDGVNAPSLGNTLQEAVQGIQNGGLFIILVGLVLVVVGLALLVVYVVRIVITLVLIISGPLFLMCHALPHTDPLARWWWKALTATLAIQFAQALVLITAVRTFLSGGVHLFGSTLSALGTLVAAIALFFILFKIPFSGFGVLTEIDVQATLKAKLGEESEPYLILGACNPQLAHQALDIDRRIGLLLPCNVVVRADGEATVVEALDPQVMVSVPEDSRLQPIADEAGRRLRAALHAVGDR
ncbi:MAG: DUF302 domain-containing protein, partial [Actinocatenispora sp.]